MDLDCIIPSNGLVKQFISKWAAISVYSVLFRRRWYIIIVLFAGIELHAPTNSTQKLKLIGRGEQFTYTPTLPLTCRLPQAAYVEIGVGCNYFI